MSLLTMHSYAATPPKVDSTFLAIFKGAKTTWYLCRRGSGTDYMTRYMHLWEPTQSVQTGLLYWSQLPDDLRLWPEHRPIVGCGFLCHNALCGLGFAMIAGLAPKLTRVAYKFDCADTQLSLCFYVLQQVYPRPSLPVSMLLSPTQES